jgi:hypothetical protein
MRCAFLEPTAEPSLRPRRPPRSWCSGPDRVNGRTSWTVRRAGRPRTRCGRLYRAVAAVVGVAGGGGVRPGRDHRTAGRQGRERAKNLLWAAGKLADYAIAAGPGGRCRRCCCTRRWPSGSPGARRACPAAAPRTLRTNLRFIGRRVVPQLYPADLPLPRERAKAAVQPGGDQRLPGAGGRPAHGGAADARGRAGLPGGRRRADPRRPARRARHRRGCRSGGVIVTVRGARPRAVPVLARYHARLLAAAGSPGTRLICGGTDPGRRNLTNPLSRAGRRDRAAPAGHLPAARDLAGRLRGAARPGHVHARGRDQLLPAARRPGRRPGPGRRGRRGHGCSGARRP